MAPSTQTKSQNAKQIGFSKKNRLSAKALKDSARRVTSKDVTLACIGWAEEAFAMPLDQVFLKRIQPAVIEVKSASDKDTISEPPTYELIPKKCWSPELAATSESLAKECDGDVDLARVLSAACVDKRVETLKHQPNRPTYFHVYQTLTPEDNQLAIKMLQEWKGLSGGKALRTGAEWKRAEFSGSIGSSLAKHIRAVKDDIAAAAAQKSSAKKSYSK